MSETKRRGRSASEARSSSFTQFALQQLEIGPIADGIEVLLLQERWVLETFVDRFTQPLDGPFTVLIGQLGTLGLRQLAVLFCQAGAPSHQQGGGSAFGAVGRG